MKRVIALALAAMLCLSACSSRQPPKKPVHFFYPVADIYAAEYSEGPYGHSSPVIRSELAESEGHEEDYIYLLNLYFRGPWSTGLHSPFPKNLTVVDFRTSANTAIVVLSQEFAVLSGINLTLAAVCTAKTVQDLTGCSRLQLSAADSFLDGSSYIFIDCNNLMEQDIIAETSAPTQPQK